MIHFLENVPENVIGISVDDKIVETDYDKINSKLKKEQENQDIRLYIEILKWEGMSLKALMEDLKTGVKFYNDFNKIAISAPQDWAKHWANFGDIVTPGIDVKYFKPSEKEKAMEWVK